VGFFRNLPLGDISFSADGSLLAVTFGPTLTIWVPETNQLKCSLTEVHPQINLRYVVRIPSYIWNVSMSDMSI